MEGGAPGGAGQGQARGLPGPPSHPSPAPSPATYHTYPRPRPEEWVVREETVGSTQGTETGGLGSAVSAEHGGTLVESFRRILEEEDCFLADIVLCGKDKGEVRAHRVMLATQSEYFKGMFRNERKEKIEMNFTSDILRNVVKTIYTGKTDINTENIQDLLEASNYLQIKSLSSKCCDFMARNLDLGNCVGVLRLADQLSIESLLQEAINFVGDHFHSLLDGAEPELLKLPVELFAKCIKSDNIILYSNYGTVLPAIQREEALVQVIVRYVKHCNYESRVKDTWPLFRALKLPFIAHHLDFKQIGLSDLANFEDDPTLHSLIRSSRIPKEDDLRRRYSVDPFSKHNSHLRAFSVKYNIWSDKFGSGPRAAYREIRPFSCEGGPDKFIRELKLWFRPYDDKKVLGGVEVLWSNGSRDVAGCSPDTCPGPPVELELQQVELGDGEHVQRVELRSGWFIENIKLVTNTGKVHGPWGGEGGEERKVHRHIRKGVNSRHVYLDGIRGTVVHSQGLPAINRVSLKWSFVMDKKVSRYSYHHSVVLRAESERVSVLELERDICLTDPETGEQGRRAGPPGHQDWPHRIFPRPVIEGSYLWSDEDEMWSPPNHSPEMFFPPPVWQPHPQIDAGEGVPIMEMEEVGEEGEREQGLGNVQGELQQPNQ